MKPLRVQRKRSKRRAVPILAREAEENRRAIARAKRERRNVTFIADDGCEVTATPGGHLFYNVAEWW